MSHQYGFEHSLERVFRHEGGYVNHPNDRGGATNLGITQQTALKYKSLWAKHNWDGNMRTLPKSLAAEIYRIAYWDKVRGDALFEIHPLLADHFFDLAVNAGPGRPVKHLQRALNLLNDRQVDYADIAEDGALGQGTFRSLQAYIRRRGKVGLENLILLLVQLQCQFYLTLSEKDESQENFTNGWVNRANAKLRSYVLAMENNDF